MPSEIKPEVIAEVSQAFFKRIFKRTDFTALGDAYFAFNIREIAIKVTVAYLTSDQRMQVTLSSQISSHVYVIDIYALFLYLKPLVGPCPDYKYLHKLATEEDLIEAFSDVEKSLLELIEVAPPEEYLVSVFKSAHKTQNMIW